MNNNVTITTLLAFFLLLASCAKEKPIGEIAPLKGDYVLPQGKSPADQHIVALFQKYGSYFLYEFSQRDLNWKFFDPSILGSKSSEYEWDFTPADPKFVGPMLDYLNKAWFRYFPDSLLKKTIPYRVLFVAKINRKIPSGKSEEEADLQPHRLENNQFVFSGCDAGIEKRLSEEMGSMRRVLQYDLLSFLIASNKFNFPQEFYKVSDYSSNTVEDTESDDYTRKRGFLLSSEEHEWSMEMNSLFGADLLQLDYTNDIFSYLYWAIRRTDQEWEADLAFPRVKQKYDILINHFKEKFGIEIRKMANDTYQ